MNSSLDLAHIPIVDAHCHPFYLTPDPLGPHDLEEQVGVLAAHTPRLLFPAAYHARMAAAVPPERRAIQNEYRVDETWATIRSAAASTVFRHLFLKRLGAYLGCEPTAAAVTEARNAATSDVVSYVDGLLKDAGVEAIVVDEGLPRPLDMDGFVRDMTVPVHRLLNMGVLLDETRATHDTFDDAVSTYRARIRDAVERQGYVGLKSHIAYTSGLDVTRPDKTRARAAFDLVAHGSDDGSGWKDVDGYFFRLALHEAQRLDVPVQIHTGLGGVGIEMTKCNPLLLESVFKDDALHGVTLVLLHGGWPYTAEVGWIVNAFPHVYADISFQIPYAHATKPQRLRELLEWAPFSKLTYGSDAYLFPELLWLGAHLAREHVDDALSALTREGVFTHREANAAATMLLHDNATRLYRLDA